jgi:predicted DNA-binding transcriptional regulator YafY
VPSYDARMDADAGPVARALHALEVIQSAPGITAVELGDRLGVSDRAARRYVSTLRQAGIPVESVRGRYGGYRLGRGVRLPPLSFTSEEVLGLVMAVLEGPAAPTAEDPLGTALGKILRALPEGVAREASAVRTRVASGPGWTEGRPRPATTSTLAAAAADRRRVRITYRGASGRDWDTEVDPWAVVVRRGYWYLLGHAHAADAVRTLRVDRVRRVVELDERFEPPADLDPAAVLEEHLGQGWEYATRVVVDAPLDRVAPWIGSPMGRLEPVEEGRRTLLVGSTSNPAMYAGEWLSRLPFAFAVEGGPELREAVAEVAARLSASLGDAS